VSQAAVAISANASALSPAAGRDRLRRAWGAAVALGAAGLLGAAAWLEPSASGLGTHEQLFLPPCSWIALMDVPCPTCGMSTAFAHAADGHLVAAFAAQPMGACAAIAASIALLAGVHTAATGWRGADLFARLWGRRAAWVIGAGLAVSWAYKVAAWKGWLG
jgi:hypothetical protein